MQTNISQYWQYWHKVAVIKLQETFVNRFTNVLFFLGKLIRLVMTVLFLLSIAQTVPSFANYSTSELLVFFLTFQVVDVLAQTLFRGAYIFTYEIRQGEFDFSLIKPINPLFKALMGHPDLNDALFIIPTVVTAIYLLIRSGVHIDATSLAIYGLLLINGLLLAAALHIFILVFGILTMEVDGFVWLYRDVSFMGQLPVQVYHWPMQFFLTCIVPIGVMVSVPATQLIGASQPWLWFAAIVFGVLFFLTSLQAWKYALRSYSSASS